MHTPSLNNKTGLKPVKMWELRDGEDTLRDVEISIITNQEIPKKYNFLLKNRLPFEMQDMSVHMRSLTHEWFISYWHWSIYLGVMYVAVIFWLQRAMKTRSRFEMRKVLFLWSFGLSIFSILGTFRSVPELVHVLKVYGFSYSVCANSFGYGLPGIYTIAFTFSKIPELLDTVFIVLRKKKLIFLHWYHHATVLVYSWYCYKVQTGAGRWIISMNYLVHSMMYFYYALRAVQVNVPKFVNTIITLMQIIQMILGCVVCAWQLYLIILLDIPCNGDGISMVCGCFLYSSYLVLFIKFFHERYIVKHKDLQQNDLKKSN